jgi:hypothetical protein
MRQDAARVMQEHTSMRGRDRADPSGNWRRDPEASPSRDRLRGHYADRDQGAWCSTRALRGLVEKNVGRSWDEVYSEIRAVLHRSPNCPRDLDRLLAGRLDRVIELHPMRVGGEWCDSRGHRLLTRGKWRDLYVDPETHKICRAPEVGPFQRRRYGARAHRLSENRVAVPIRGAWFEVTLAPVPATPDLCAGLHDAVLGPYVEWASPVPPSSAAPWYFDEEHRQRREPFDNLRDRLEGLRIVYGTAGLYGAAKRQLGKREIRRLRLNVRAEGERKSERKAA